MTAADLAALLRVDPARGAYAIKLAKVAGKWEPTEDGRWTRPMTGRIAADEDAQDWHDMDLTRNGWTLA